MRRALRIGAGLGLAFVIVTCTERDLAGPRRPGAAAFDLASFLVRTPGQPPLPIDSIRVTLRRVSDDAVTLDTIFPVRRDTLADTLVVRLNVALHQNSEDFIVTVLAVGSGIPWYTATGPLTITAGALARANLTAVYTGIGRNAKRVSLRPADTTVVGGLAVLYAAIVFDSSDVPIPGVPLGYLVRDTGLAGISTATVATALLVGRTNRRDSSWVVVETPLHQKDSTRVHITPPAALLQKVSGDLQTGVVGGALPQPLQVRVRDGLGGPFKGYPVTWLVTSGTATLSAATTITDDSGFAGVTATPASLGGLSVQATAASLAGSPATFAATITAGTIRQVIISPKLDTVARGAAVQYTAVLKDASGNTVSGTVTWTSTVQTVATVSGAGLASAVGGDSTRIIAAAGGYADTARLLVRALRTVVVSPADTVVSAVNDSFPLTSVARDNFGAVIASGFTTRYVSASPSVVSVNAASGRVKAVGPGNGVVVVRDSVDSALVVQGTATVRVNQVTTRITSLPARPDSLQIGIGGRGQIVARALDRNGFSIPGKTFTWRSVDPAVVSVDASGLVTGVGLGATFVVDSVDNLKDSVRVAVVPLPPALIQWAFDSVAVGNGGNLSVALSLSRTSGVPLTVTLSSSDSLVARTVAGCPGAVLKKITIPIGSAATSVLLCGLAAGRATVVAQDSAGLYLPDTMVVTVVSTIEFREVGQFGRQTYFYVNQNETHRAQVFLSDPAPAGGLGVTFVYGRAGTSVATPAPAIIPAGQLAADVVLQGLAPGTDSVVPTSGGFVGKYSYVTVAPNQLTVQRPYPYTATLGVGQAFQPYVAITYPMDHLLTVATSLASGIGLVQSQVTIPAGQTTQYLTVAATAPGKTALNVTAPGWVAAVDTFIFTTPRLQAYGPGGIIAGNPALAAWTAYTADSLGYQHGVKDTLVVTALSRNASAVAVDSPTVRVPPGSSGITRSNALRALPTAGGDSAWIVLSAPGYSPDSFKVLVTKPALTLSLGYPYTGRLALSTIFQSAGYVQIPYARPDTFTVTFRHSRPGVARGPSSVRIPANQTTAYLNLVGDTLGIDTLFIDPVGAPGYVVSGSPVVYTVDSLHVRPYSYPGVTNYTISSPYAVSAYAYDAVDGQTRPLVAPLRVNLVSSKPATFTLDSAFVTIDSGQSYSFNHPDALRFVGVDTVGARILSSAPGSSADSSGLIKVFPTPLGIQLGYPYTVGRGLRLQNNYVYVSGGVVPNNLTVTLRRFDPTLDTLTADTVVILKGQSSSTSFQVWALDSTRTDSIVATAPGYVTAKTVITPEPVSLLQGGLPGSRLTTDPPYRPYVYTGTRSRIALNPVAPVSVTVVSSDPNVMQLDSASSVNVRGDTAVTVVDTNRNYGYVRVIFVGSGSARLRYSAPGFLSDSTPLVTVSGPSLGLSLGANQTLGVGQVFAPTPNQYVYVNNPVVGTPLVVSLLKSDSGLPAANQAFTLSATSVTIPVGSTTSNPFEVLGNSLGAAVLTARATGYSQATTALSIGAPRLVAAPKNIALAVGQTPSSETVYATDQSGTSRYVASALSVGAASADPSVAAADSLTLQIPSRQYYTSVGIRGIAKGATQIVFSASGYKPDTVVVQVDTAQLALYNPPNGLGAGQVAPGQMYVQVPFTTAAPITVSLGTTNSAVLTVPASVTIPAGSYYTYFDVTGVGVGQASVTATATTVKAAAPVPVRISTPRFVVSLAATSYAGQKTTVTVSAQDSLGNYRRPAAMLAVTLVSSNATHTAFDSTTIRIPTSTYYASTDVVFDTAGNYTVTANATGYPPGNATTTTTGALVVMASTAFAPQTVTIPVGTYVTWKNNDPVNHTTTSDASVWSATVLPGTTYQRFFNTPGTTYTYHCAIHPQMTGTVIVQ